MKKIRFLLAVFCMTFTYLNAQDINKVIHINFDNTPLREAFLIIEKESGYNFIFSNYSVKKEMYISLKEKKIKIVDLLSKLTQMCNTHYKIEDKQIIIIPNQDNVPPQKTVPGKKRITGIVTDTSSNPIIGATIIDPSSNQGTVTDIDGNFSFECESKFTVSSVGYKTQELSANKNFYNIVLQEDVQLVDEVIVVGYRGQKKVNLTGAVNSIEQDALENRPIMNVSSGLQGMLPGVSITQSSGQPGNNKTSIRIRGLGTISSNADPYILIDGVEGDMDLLNPNDIESISVLKDAASSAIYGARAANGVILVTTKKASGETKKQISYSGYYGLQRPTRLPEMVNGYEYMILHNEAKKNKGDAELFSEAVINIYRSGNFDTDEYADTDWINEIYRKTAPQQSHNINLSGNTGKLGYYVSYAFFKQDGLVINNPFNSRRHNIRMRFNSDFFNGKLNLDSGITYVDQKNISSPYDDTGSIFRLANRIDPLVPVKYKNGEWGVGSVNNPMAVAMDGGENTEQLTDLIASVSASLHIIKGLDANFQFTYNKQGISNHNFKRGILKYDRFGIPLLGNDQIKSKLAENNYSRENKNLMFNFNYKFNLEKHHFNILAGFNEEYSIRKFVSASRENFPMGDEVESLNVGIENISNDANSSHNSLRSYFARLNYNYADKYLFEANIRNDGSSRFAPEQRWGVFPSFSMGWRFNEERFMSSLSSILNSGKIRISWGMLGNERVGKDGNYYPYLGLIESIPSTPIGGIEQTGFYMRTAANRHLTWEKVEMSNIGIDLGFLNNRLNFNLDLFLKKTTDALLKAEYSSIIGVYKIEDLPEVNMGSIENKGWEMTLNWRDQIGKFNYSVMATVSDVKNKVTSLGNSNPRIDEELRQVGEPLNAYYGYVTDGLLQPSDFEYYDENKKKYMNPKVPVMDAYKTIVQPGDIKYMDITNNGTIDGDDRRIIGNPNPRYYFALKLDAEWKGIDISAYFQGVGKVNGYLGYEARHALIDDFSIPKRDHLDRWTPDNMNASYPRLYYGQGHNREFSDYWVENASYLRFKNLQIGYNIPFDKLIKKHISKLRVYFSADNLLTATRFYKYYDPEIGRTNGSDYPQVKTFVIGANITFNSK